MSPEASYRYPGSRPFQDTPLDRELFWGRDEDGSWSSPPGRGELAYAGAPIPAGTYTVEVLGLGRRVLGSTPVTIAAGSVTSAIVRVEK